MTRLGICLVILAALSITALGELWSPSNITTIAWYDASDTSTIDPTFSGSPVSVTKWYDKSTNSLHLTPSQGPPKPKYGTNTLNGLNVITYSAYERMPYKGNTPAFPVPSSGDLAVFAVVNNMVPDDNATESIVSLKAGNDFEFKASSTAVFNGVIGVRGIGSSVSFTNGPFVGPDQFALIFDFTGTGKFYGYENGTKGTVDSTYSAKLGTPAIMSIGTGRDTLESLDGDYAEFVFVEDCSDETRQTIEGYLAHKWGLVDKLPTGHPWKRRAPGEPPPGTVLIIR